MKNLKTVGVMGSGRELQSELAEPLGRALAGLPVNLLTGGGYGVMYSVSKGFTSIANRQGLSIGCIPMKETPEGGYQPVSASYPNAFVEVPIYTPLGVFDKNDPDKVNRNYVNILTSDVVLALPGSGGTQQEVSLAMRFKKAVLLYGPKDQFNDFPAELPRADNLDDAMGWVCKNAGLASDPAP